MKFSLMEIMMAYIGKAHLEEFSDEKKWTILGLINKPGSHLETNIGVEFKMYSNEDLQAILLEKIINLQKQLSEIYPNEKVVQTEIQKQGPDSKTLSSTDEDANEIIHDALSVHDSSDESVDKGNTEDRNCDDRIPENESTQESAKDMKEVTPAPFKKKPGRPKKSIGNDFPTNGTPVQGKKKRGRPKKRIGADLSSEVDQGGEDNGHIGSEGTSVQGKRKRGRPKKSHGADPSNQVGRDEELSDNGHFMSEGTPVQAKKKRGRPKMSIGTDLSSQVEQDGDISDNGHVESKRTPVQVKRKRGRPKSLGSKSDDGHVKRKLGRPKGSKNKSVIIYNQ